jgi:hypothetical protein
VRFTRIIFICGVAVTVAAVVLFAWLYLPSLRQRASHTFTPQQLALDSGETFPRGWTSRLDAPRNIHLGESGTLRLTISPELTALPPGPGSDALSGYTVIVEARAEISAAGASPSGLSSQTMAPGQAARFEWRITPQSEGVLEGKVWLYLRFIPTDGAEAIQRPLSAQTVTINSNTFFGRATGQVRQIAFIGLGIGLVLALPYLLMRSHARRARIPAQSPDQEL